MAVAVKSCRTTGFAKKLHNLTGISVFPWGKKPTPVITGLPVASDPWENDVTAVRELDSLRRVAGGEYN